MFEVKLIINSRDNENKIAFLQNKIPQESGTLYMNGLVSTGNY
jgi:hypothetical protein